MKPLVSIIIPCYNDGQYIEETLASAEAQTYPHCEIIVVDDHSTDAHTMKVLSRLQAKGTKVISTTEGHKGLSAARNSGIEIAQGKYILPLDSDDIIDPVYIERGVDILESNADIDICGCHGKYFGLKHSSFKTKPRDPIYNLFHAPHFISTIYAKADWEAVGGYDESILFLEDISFWISIYALGRKTYILPYEYFHYRIRKNSLMSQATNKEKRRKALVLSYEKNKKYIETLGLDIYLALDNCLEKEEENKILFSYKILSPIFKLEFSLRQWVKRLLGRA